MKVILKKTNSDEREFWKYFLHIRNASLNTLSDVEIRVMTEVLAGNPYKSMFKVKDKDKLLTLLNYPLTQSSRSFISKIKRQLRDKGFLEDTGVTRGDVLVAQPLRDYQLKVKKELEEGKNLSINLSFLINEV